MKHTPGPWAQSGSSVMSPGHAWICEMSEPHHGHQRRVDIGSLDWNEAMANCRLIAAAPELLAALEKIDAIGANVPFEVTGSAATLREKLFACREIARAAIAKTEGEQP